jgi:arginyl-tRNA synthetase
MGVEEDFRVVVERGLRSLASEGRIPAEALSSSFTVERPKRAEHGDLATNAPLALTKSARMPPRDLAQLLKAKLEAEPVVTSVDIAGPGFLNVRLAPSAFHSVLAEIVKAGEGFGRAAAASGDRILLEFVSANPTGPLLVSHARGALVGDAVARLLEAAGHRVTREYYVNDFGNQVRIFARSVLAAAFDEPPPPEGYPGAYVKAAALHLVETHRELLDEAHRLEKAHAGDATRESEAYEATLGELSRQCVRLMLDGVPGSADLPGIKATLRHLGVLFDCFYSEESLHRWGRVGAALSKLEKKGFVRPLPDGALVFQMPEGEGEKDEQYEGENRDSKEKSASAQGGRVVRKSDGKTFTYFSSDIAYHADKLDRGYDRLIDVLGADHHGYVARIRNVLSALGLPKEKFEVLLFQLVSLVRDGKPVRMGKRLGNLITCDEVLEEIDEALGEGAGADALRYFYLSRRTENPVEIDVELAKKASLDNPAIYIQYGHARLCSILRKARTDIGLEVPPFDPKLASLLTLPEELAILQRIGTFPRVVREAAKELAPSKIVTFLQELAQDFHGYWTQTYKAKDPILPPRTVYEEAGWQSAWNVDRTLARLVWIDAIRRTYSTGLGLVGIRAPERMLRAGTSGREDDDEPAEMAG